MKKFANIFLPVLSALGAAIFVFAALYQFDNKYTATGPQPIGGLLYLNDAEAEELHFLVWDWAYYPDMLLSPQDFTEGQQAPVAQQYMFIGQYSNYALGRKGMEPHGQASYRLDILLPPEKQLYTLLMPNVYCAYRLYVNGELLMEMGEPEAGSYQAAIGERAVNFEAAGSADILVTTSSQGYITGGMTHPPVFGQNRPVQNLQAAKQLIAAAACVVALLLGLMFLYVRLFGGYKRGTLYSLLCLCFIGFFGIPLLRGALPLGIQPWSTFYFGCYYGMYLLVLLLLASLYGFSRKTEWGIVAAGDGVCLFAICLTLLPAPNEEQIQLFSALSEVYKWGIVAVMLLSALHAAWKGTRLAVPVLWAVAFFSFSLAADRLLPLFEPILGGWFAEVSGFVLLCILGTVLWSDMVRAMRERTSYQQALLLAEKNQLMLREHYRTLDEQLAINRALHHDFRQQIILLQGYADNEDWPSLRQFLADYQKSVESNTCIQYTQNDIFNIITRYYSDICAKEQIAFSVNYDIPTHLDIRDIDLTIVLGNLLENAVEACRDVAFGERQIEVSASAERQKLVLTVKNRIAHAPVPVKQYYRSTKAGGGQGLRSVATATQRNGGAAIFKAEDEIFTAIAVMCI
ncbi:GHKL domain-containing protein [Ruminococcaceae bacterium OttesenSCG-928-I18]|nr:GHKL domain-containing protein [Ruminococcaceae bacterium OttesenSCG-928-I18]